MQSRDEVASAARTIVNNYEDAHQHLRGHYCRTDLLAVTKQAALRIQELSEALTAVQSELESVARNTNRGYGYGQAVCISTQTREQVKRALLSEEKTV